MNGSTSSKRVALDSNLFIYHFEDNPQFSLYTSKIFQQLSRGEIKAITSVISITETLSYPLPKRVINEITEAFLNLSNLGFIEVDQRIAFEAAKIRREYGFRLPDSIQLATAIEGKAKAFISNDKRLRKFKKLKIILLNQI